MTESQFYGRLKFAWIPSAIAGVLFAIVSVLSAFSTDVELTQRLLVSGMAALGSFVMMAISYALWRMVRAATNARTK